MSTAIPLLMADARLHVLSAGTPCRVLEYLDRGGQGSVYRVEVGGAEFALKWYHPHIVRDPGLQRRIQEAVRRGPPDPRFLWPLAIVVDHERRGYGYLMALRPPAYRKLVNILSPQPETRLDFTLAERAHLGMQIAAAFLQLHAGGLCYQDINFGAFFVDPAVHSVLVCDNDNVDVDGAAAANIGTWKFMAPEIVRREAGASTNTDLYSLAVLLFYLLTFAHPLEGRAALAIDMLTPEDELVLYASNPRFMFDPADQTNAADPEQQRFQVSLWQSLPPALRTLFERAFGAGLRNPAQRVLETEWISAFAAVRDQAVTCPACGFEQAPARRRGAAAEPGACAWCAAPLPRPPVLHVGRSAIVAVPGARLFQSHLTRGGGDQRIGEVVTNDRGMIGLRNLGAGEWQASDSAGRSSAVAPGRVVGLRPGVRIAFGAATGEVDA